MATIYRKTEKGQAEIETRLFRLLPRIRTALILVDGHRTDVELAKLIPGDPVAALQTLLADGFIETVAVVEMRAPIRPAQPVAGDTAARAAPIRSQAFDQRRRDAIRSLTDQLGPVAEDIGIRMERCSDWNQLLPVLQMAQKVLRSSRGATAATDFGARFIDVPPS